MGLTLIPVLQAGSTLRTSIFLFVHACIFSASFIILTIGATRYSEASPGSSVKPMMNSDNEPTVPGSFDGIMRILREDERKVCLTILNEGGVVLQKDIRWKTGFSKVKTHRVVERLAERGVVNIKKTEGRNTVSLAPWLYNIPLPSESETTLNNQID